ncbi:MAG: hypothetical protein OEN20_12475, partial [Gammaproteobacteria bacterium]|nr:hypothetical protein [Gammaproteobacteria bacterium]
VVIAVVRIAIVVIAVVVIAVVVIAVVALIRATRSDRPIFVGNGQRRGLRVTMAPPGSLRC